MNSVSGQRQQGAVLLIVLLAMMFATAALVFFIEKSTPDLLVEKRAAADLYLRREAENALEASLAVLSSYREVLGDFHHPAEGWGEPLALSGYIPGDGRKVSVRVTDESGRIPLVNTEYSQLAAIFRSWGLAERDAERCADALLVWTRPDYVPRTLLGNEDEAYQRGALRYRPPGRPLRHFAELAVIAVVRDHFFDEKGRPNLLYRRFTETFSLLAYAAPNLNAAVPEVWVDASGLGTAQGAERWREYQSGQFRPLGRSTGYFRTTDEVTAALGPLPSGLKVGVTAQVLRVEARVSEGVSSYRLAVLVSAPGGAQWPSGDVRPPNALDRNGAADAKSATPEGAVDPSALVGAGKIKYPFVVLERIAQDGPADSRDTPSPTLAP